MWPDVSDDRALGEALISLLGTATEPASQQRPTRHTNAALRSAVAPSSAHPGAGQPLSHVRSRPQTTRFGVASGGHRGNHVTEQIGGYSCTGLDRP